MFVLRDRETGKVNSGKNLKLPVKAATRSTTDPKETDFSFLVHKKREFLRQTQHKIFLHFGYEQCYSAG